MDSENIFKIPSIPNTPSKVVLSQMSANHINQQRIPQSPSLPGQLSDFDKKLHSASRHAHRSSSDVRSIVEQWDRISQNGVTPPASPTRLAGNTQAALQRAILGREEAEAQLAESQIRERRISERVESLMEELQEVREKLIANKEKYKLEIIASRKDAFKSDSKRMMVESELKDARHNASRWRAEADREKEEKEKAMQEAFERAYVVAGLVEEVENLKKQSRSVETVRLEAEVEKAHALADLKDEVEQLKEKLESRGDVKEVRDTEKAYDVTELTQEVESLKSQLKVHQKAKEVEDNEKSVAIATLTEQVQSLKNELKAHEATREEQTTEGHTMEAVESVLVTNSMKNETAQATDHGPPKTLKPTKDGAIDDQIRELKDQLRWAKTLHSRDEDLIHFLQMQCQFKACSCRSAEIRERLVQNQHRAISNHGVRDTEGTTGIATTDKMFPIKTSIDPKECTVIRDFDAKIDDHSITTLDRPDPGNRPASTSNITTTEHFDAICHDSRNSEAEDEMSFVQLVCRNEMADLSPEPMALLEDATQVLVNHPLTPTIDHSNVDRPRPRSVHATTSVSGIETTTTTTIPLRGLDGDDIFTPAPRTPATGPRSVPLALRPAMNVHGDQLVPGTPVSRQEALRQIRERRDRARSVHLKSMRQVSYASAPGGM